MKLILFILLFFSLQNGYSQNKKEIQPTANVRLSFLLFPFKPLLSLEVRTIGNLTLQVETNFVNTHGANLKYFLKDRMSENYVFTGVALVGNKLLRKDEKTTYLPYIGYGYAYRFGNKKQWTFDSRIGLGATTNADQNGIYPVIKTGIGRIF
jgi:hypothetical protein